MQISVTTTQGLGRRMTVALPVEKVEEEIKERLKSLSGKVKVDGFRPGKVPFSVLERRYGKQVRDEVQYELVQKTFSEAVTQEKLMPVGQPHIELGQVGANNAFEYIATFEVYPNIEVSLPADLAVQRPAVTVNEADIDTVVERIRKQNVTWAEAARPSKEGDRLTIDFDGFIDDQPFSGGKADGYKLTLGSKTLVGDFEKQLEGVSAGAKVNVAVTFPAEYPVADLAAKAARFDVTVHHVEESVLPTLDKAFFEKFGVGEGTETAFRQQVRQNIEREVNEAVKGRVKNQVIDALVQHMSVELPQALVDSEISVRMQRTRSQLASNGVDEKTLRLDRTRYEDGARRAVKVGLIVSEILRRNQIRIKPEDLRAKVDELASTYEDPQAVINWYYADRNRLSDIEAVLLEDSAIDWVLRQAKLEDKVVSVMELLDRPSGATA